MLGSVEARNADLDATLGANKSSVIPATLYLALYEGNPADDAAPGVEVTGGGYARLAVATDGTKWGAAADGVKTNNAAIAFPASTGAWDRDADWAAFIDTASGAGDLYDVGQLGQAIVVAAAGALVEFPAGSISISVPEA